MGKNQKEKQIYMTGFTLGIGFGLLVPSVWILLVGEEAQGEVLTLASWIMGITLIIVSFIWRRRANKS